MKQTFFTIRPGRLPYRAGLTLQEKFLHDGLPDGSDILILLEHPPTITLGRGADENNLLSSHNHLREKGIDLFQVARGGDTTYHGPGQVVGYPLVDLSRRGKDLHRYLRDLEEVLIRALAHWKITGVRQQGRTGVWVGGRKIASIGVGVRRWISWHGFALNLETDLSGFAHIVPCGLHDVQMTSMQQLLDKTPKRQTVEEVLISAFAEVFNSNHAGPYDEQNAPQTGLA